MSGAPPQQGPTPDRAAPRRPRRAFVPSSGMVGPPSSTPPQQLDGSGRLPTVYSQDAEPEGAGWDPDDELGMMPMRTSGYGYGGGGGGDTGEGGGFGTGAHTAASLVEGARGFLEGFRQMAVGGGAAGGPEGGAEGGADGSFDVEGGMGGTSEEDEEWEEDEQEEDHLQDDTSSRVSSTVSSDEDEDEDGRRRRKKKGRKKKGSRKRRGSTASSVGSLGSQGSFVSSVTSVSSVSSEGLRRAFEESLAMAMQAAGDADEANAERRRLADEYLDVALYIYDQVSAAYVCRLSLSTQKDCTADCDIDWLFVQLCGRLQQLMEDMAHRHGGGAAR